MPARLLHGPKEHWDNGQEAVAAHMKAAQDDAAAKGLYRGAKHSEKAILQRLRKRPSGAPNIDEVRKGHGA